MYKAITVEYSRLTRLEPKSPLRQNVVEIVTIKSAKESDNV